MFDTFLSRETHRALVLGDRERVPQRRAHFGKPMLAFGGSPRPPGFPLEHRVCELFWTFETWAWPPRRRSARRARLTRERGVGEISTLSVVGQFEITKIPANGRIVDTVLLS